MCTDEPMIPAELVRLLLRRKELQDELEVVCDRIDACTIELIEKQTDPSPRRPIRRLSFH